MKTDFWNFYQIFTFYEPLSQKKGFLRKSLSVCLSLCPSVVSRILDNSPYNHQIELSFGILYRSQKSKGKFVNQPHPTKIVKIREFLYFLLLFLPIIPMIFFDSTKIRKFTVSWNFKKVYILCFDFESTFENQEFHLLSKICEMRNKR